MADEKQEKETQIVTEKPADEEIVYATLAEVMTMPQKRLEKAKPFFVEDIGKYFLIAPADTTVAYDVVAIRVLGLSEQREDWVKIVNNMLLKACIIKPELDDAAIEALMKSDCNVVAQLVEKCAEISELDQGTRGTESFT